MTVHTDSKLTVMADNVEELRRLTPEALDVYSEVVFKAQARLDYRKATLAFAYLADLVEEFDFARNDYASARLFEQTEWMRKLV